MLDERYRSRIVPINRMRKKAKCHNGMPLLNTANKKILSMLLHRIPLPKIYWRLISISSDQVSLRQTRSLQSARSWKSFENTVDIHQRFSNSNRHKTQKVVKNHGVQWECAKKNRKQKYELVRSRQKNLMNIQQDDTLSSLLFNLALDGTLRKVSPQATKASLRIARNLC